MTSVSVHEAKTHLSRLIERVLAGEEVTVTRNKEPVIRLVRAIEPASLSPSSPTPTKKPLLGALKGQFTVDDSFFEPLSNDELALWYDGKI